jgi:hypothetical protein
MARRMNTNIDELKAQAERAESQYRAALKTKKAAAAEAVEALRAAVKARTRLVRVLGIQALGRGNDLRWIKALTAPKARYGHFLIRYQRSLVSGEASRP